MAITSSRSVAESHTQADGTRYVRHYFTDSVIGEFSLSLRKHPQEWAETEYAQWRTDMVPRIEERLAEEEFNRLMGGG